MPLNISKLEKGLKKVNIFVGRYQPFTKGHLSAFKEMYEYNGLPVVVLIVRGSKPDPERRPFDEDLQISMFNELKDNHEFLECSYVLTSAAIDLIFETLRPTYEPVLWGFGTDRKERYEYMINKESYRQEINVLPEFSGYEIERTDDDVSASKIRQALSIEDYDTFKSLMPESLIDFYDSLKNKLNFLSESHIKSFNDFINK